MSEVRITNKTIQQGIAFSCFLLFVYSILFPATTFAASYAISPSSGTYQNGKTFTAKVMINAGSDAVNTGDATITYDSTKLTAVSVTKDSTFNLWVTEPSISAGKISFAGGGTTPVSGSKSVITITFKAKAEGSAKVDVSSGTLLAGAGQNVYTGSTGATYTITAGSVEPEKPTETEQPKEETNKKIPTPDAPVIKSSTHEEESEWYSISDAKLSWDIPFGVQGLMYGFDQDPNGTTTELKEPPISSLDINEIDDGVWYYHMMYKNRGGWGSSTTYTIQIDTTPPDEFSISAAGGDLTVELRFEAFDSLSGIASYQIIVDDGRARDVQPTELTNGYRISNIDPGDHTIKVKAIDFAGNEREAMTTALVTGTKPVDEEVTTSGFSAIYWVSLLFMAALAVVITMLTQERRKYREEKDHIKRETTEVGDRLINIFGVLRDEIEEKVTELSHKPNMTDNERNILEGLKDALDISEELIDKEIEDVRKLLK
jgi:hypothetical protein